MDWDWIYPDEDDLSSFCDDNETEGMTLSISDEDED